MTIPEYLRSLSAALMLMVLALGALVLLHALALFEVARFLFSLPMRLAGRAGKAVR